ncbi:ABC transporter ATP-binding protein [Brevibacterium marinum]|uniref:Putative ABC transport system ATP-binding protein n=1 Tax=Brevibacterium marinum TaxID=418643 RepID=A0A846RPJ4_9MICO|nr:ABC transporter ATP-binding protein [Brevibacterium marinum]NJC55659.1 putative ABC transport system ATP-binding protein [Brevibacterium marinum]
MPSNHAADLIDVTKNYGIGEGAVTALDHVSIRFAAGTFTAIMGPSGSGKSSLLQCAAGLDNPTSGQVLLAGVDVGQLNEQDRTVLRRDHVGFVFQSFNLVGSLTAAQNVELPLRIGRRRLSKSVLEDALRIVGLEDRSTHKPSELSGGQQQRVALARAMVTRPEVLFADEPTGALDSATSHDVLALLRDLVDQQGQTVVMVTHDADAASYADRVIFLVDGVVSEILDLDSQPRQHQQRADSATRIAAQMTQVGA